MIFYYLVIPLMLLAGIVLVSWLSNRARSIPCTREGAILALDNIREWAKWMTGLESAALGALFLLAFDEKRAPRHMCIWEKLFAFYALLFLGLALIVAAWILSGLGSIPIRLYKIKDGSSLHDFFDIHEQTIFARKSPRLSVILTVHHFFWAVGLFSLGLCALTSYISH